ACRKELGSRHWYQPLRYRDTQAFPLRLCVETRDLVQKTCDSSWNKVGCRSTCSEEYPMKVTVKVAKRTPCSPRAGEDRVRNREGRDCVRVAGWLERQERLASYARPGGTERLTPMVFRSSAIGAVRHDVRAQWAASMCAPADS